MEFFLIKIKNVNFEIFKRTFFAILVQTNTKKGKEISEKVKNLN